MRKLELLFNFGKGNSTTIMTHLNAPLQVRSGVLVCLELSDNDLADDQIKGWYEANYIALGVQVNIVSDAEETGTDPEISLDEVQIELDNIEISSDTDVEDIESIPDQSEQELVDQVENADTQVEIEDLPENEVFEDLVDQVENADEQVETEDHIENVDAVIEESSQGKIDVLGNAKKSVSEMTFNEMKAFAKENDIKVLGRTKKAYEKAIKSWERKNK